MQRIWTYVSSFIPARFWFWGGRPPSVTQSEDGEIIKPFTDIPRPSYPIIGIFSAIRGMSKLHEKISDTHERYGPITRTSLPIVGNIVSLADPDAIEQVMRQEGRYPKKIEMRVWIQARKAIGEEPGIVIGDDEQWHRMRRAANRVLLNTKNIAVSDRRLTDVNLDFIQYLRRNRNDDDRISLNEIMTKWSLESISNVLYEFRLGFFSETPDPDGVRFADATFTMVETTKTLMLLPKWLAPRLWKTHTDSLRTLFEIARKCAEGKKKTIDEDGLADENTRQTFGVLHNLLLQCKESGATEKEAMAVITELMMAGVDTTSNAGIFAIYELSRNPEVQERLLEEMVRVVPDDEEPTARHLQDMPYLKAVVKEVLRLYPVAHIVSRILPEAAVVMGYHIPAGTVVNVPLYYLGRQDKLYENAHQFLPDRWLRGDVKASAVHTFGYLPFGFGGRSCVGRRVAEMELHLLLVQLVRRFLIEPVNLDPIRLKTRLALVPDGPVDVFLRDR